MPQLFTELQTQKPPEGKYQSQVTLSSTTDEEPIVQAALAGEARTLADEPTVETSDDGQVTASSWEHESSTRNQLLERLAQAEQEAEQELRDWKPLTESDKAAKQEALERPNVERYNVGLEQFKAEHPDFDDVMAQANDVDFSEAKRQALMEAGPQAVYELAKDPEAAQRFAAMSDGDAEAYLKDGRKSKAPTATVDSVYQRALEEEAAAGRDAAAFADTYHKPLFTNDEEGQARYLDLAAIVKTLPNREEVVIALTRDPATVQKIVTAKSGADVQQLLKTLSAKLQFPVTEQKAPAKSTLGKHSKLVATRPVGGTMKSSVPMDQMDYQDYVKEREKQIRARRAR